MKIHIPTSIAKVVIQDNLNLHLHTMATYIWLRINYLILCL